MPAKKLSDAEVQAQLGGGVDEPSSGMVQRVEQSGDRFEHPQREGDQRLRFYASGKN